MGAFLGSALAGTVFKALFAAMADALFGWLDKRQQIKDAERRGAAVVIAKTNQEAADAERRAAEVPGGTTSGTLSDLDKGTF